jgi:DNA-directed RNA polymerase subunit RPC12/RpoP
MTAVVCGTCGASLEEDAGLQEDKRKPCPACGSLTRRIQLEACSMMSVGAMASAATLISNDVRSIGAIIRCAYCKVKNFNAITRLTVPPFHRDTHRDFGRQQGDKLKRLLARARC